MSRLARERSVLEARIREAGDVILEMQKTGFEVAHKSNADPVTTADLEADRILRESLTAAFPDTGWLSEETRDVPERLAARRVWIVDPIDGTKEFATGIPEYGVSVALVEDGKPVLGAVYNPAVGELYLAETGQGATLNGTPIRADARTRPLPILLASRSEVKRGEWECFEAHATVRICGSIAYKLALIAAGRADGTFSLGPKNEWDIAAGVLLVEEAGGMATDVQRRPFVFNQADTLVDGIVAVSAPARETIWGLIEAAPDRS